jgi:hypothetical protein
MAAKRRYKRPKSRRVPVAQRKVKVQSMLPWWAVEAVQEMADREGRTVSNKLCQLLLACDELKDLDPAAENTRSNVLLAGLGDVKPPTRGAKR